jgi:hypothetical protein
MRETSGDLLLHVQVLASQMFHVKLIKRHGDDNKNANFGCGVLERKNVSICSVLSQ